MALVRVFPILFVGTAFFFLGGCRPTFSAEADTVAAGDTATTVRTPTTFTFDLYWQENECWYDLRGSDVDTVFSARPQNQLRFVARGGSSYYVRDHPWMNVAGVRPLPDSAIFNDVWQKQVAGQRHPERAHGIAIACCDPEVADSCRHIDAYPASDSIVDNPDLRSAGGPRMKVQE